MIAVKKSFLPSCGNGLHARPIGQGLLEFGIFMLVGVVLRRSSGKVSVRLRGAHLVSNPEAGFRALTEKRETGSTTDPSPGLGESQSVLRGYQRHTEVRPGV